MKMHRSLDSRAFTVLTLLLESTAYISCRDISESLGVTLRQARTSVDQVDRWLADQGFFLDKRPGMGCFLQCSEAENEIILHKFHNEKDIKINLSGDDRKAYLEFLLLTTGTPLFTKEISHLLNVSNATISKDLTQLDPWFQAYQLKIVKRPNCGCIIQGDEDNIRRAIIDFIFEHVDLSVVVDLVNDSKSRWKSTHQKPGSTEYLIISYLEDLALQEFIPYVQSIENDLQADFVDLGQWGLTLYLALLVHRHKRLQNGGSRPITECEQMVCIPAARKVIQRLNSIYSIEVSDHEVALLSQKIKEIESKISYAHFSQATHCPEGMSTEVTEIVDHLLSHVSLKLYPGLRVDHQLYYAFADFTNSFINHVRRTCINQNRLLNEIRAQNPYVHQVAVDCGAILERSTGRKVNEEEIGEIAMCLLAAMEKLQLRIKTPRILIVCASGLATAWLLDSRIQTEFPQIEIVGVLSVNEIYSQIIPDDIDLVISTIELSEIGVPREVVSPLLPPQDVEKLRKIFFPFTVSFHSDKTRKSVIPNLSDVLSTKTIELGVRADHWVEVVDRACFLLQRNRAVKPCFSSAIKELIAENGPYMVIAPGVALLHASPSSGVNYMSVGLVTLQKPVNFGHPQNDPVDIVFVLSVIDKSSHLGILSDLLRIIKNEKAVERIRITAHKTNIIQLVNRISSPHQ